MFVVNSCIFCPDCNIAGSAYACLLRLVNAWNIIIEILVVLITGRLAEYRSKY